MSSALKLGSEPASPCEEPRSLHASVRAAHLGLSKRELIAAMALHGIVSNTKFDAGSAASMQELAVVTARVAIAFADGLLEALAE